MVQQHGPHNPSTRRSKQRTRCCSCTPPIPGCSRILQNAPECSRMLQNAPECPGLTRDVRRFPRRLMRASVVGHHRTLQHCFECRERALHGVSERALDRMQRDWLIPLPRGQLFHAVPCLQAKVCWTSAVNSPGQKRGKAGNRTRIGGFKVLSDNHYTTSPD